MVALTLKEDPTFLGKGKRYTIGKPKDELSGALYLKEGFEVPDAVIMAFPKSSENKEAQA